MNRVRREKSITQIEEKRETEPNMDTLIGTAEKKDEEKRKDDE